MRLAEWAIARPGTTATLIGLATGAVLGLLWPVNVPPPAAAERAHWAAADLARLQYRESQFSSVRDAPVWGGGSLPDGVVKAVDWALVGIISDSSPAALVLASGDVQARRVRVGADLPDGSTLRAILVDAVRYSRDGCDYVQALYSEGEIAEGDCGAPGPDAAPQNGRGN